MMLQLLNIALAPLENNETLNCVIGWKDVEEITGEYERNTATLRHKNLFTTGNWKGCSFSILIMHADQQIYSSFIFLCYNVFSLYISYKGPVYGVENAQCITEYFQNDWHWFVAYINNDLNRPRRLCNLALKLGCLIYFLGHSHEKDSTCKKIGWQSDWTAERLRKRIFGCLVWYFSFAQFALP